MTTAAQPTSEHKHLPVSGVIALVGLLGIVVYAFLFVFGGNHSASQGRWLAVWGIRAIIVSFFVYAAANWRNA
jgi:hypothetical protein